MEVSTKLIDFKNVFTLIGLACFIYSLYFILTLRWNIPALDVDSLIEVRGKATEFSCTVKRERRHSTYRYVVYSDASKYTRIDASDLTMCQEVDNGHYDLSQPLDMLVNEHSEIISLKLGNVVVFDLGKEVMHAFRSRVLLLLIGVFFPLYYVTKFYYLRVYLLEQHD